MQYYEVAVAAPLDTTLTYKQPEGTNATLPAGIRVLVPLGNRLVTGYVLGQASGDDGADFVIKSIADLLDPDPIFPVALIPFFRWISTYYHYPLGEVIKTALPAGLIVRSGRKIELTTEGKAMLPEVVQKTKARKAWMTKLLEKGRLTSAAVALVWKKPAQQRIARKWQEQGWVNIKEILVEPGIKGKKITMVSLESVLADLLVTFSASPDQPLAFSKELKKSEQKTLELFFARCKGRPLLPRPELTREYSGAGTALKSLAQKGLVSLTKQRCYRDPFGCVPPFFPAPEQLTAEQATVLDTLVPAIKEQGFSPFLLFGVTGCGKTEVYLQAAKACLELGKSVLVLVPEIALASQVEAHFYSRFGDTLAVLHSGLTVGERFDQWQRIVENKASVVIGARSAVFSPITDPGLIIVDEEHEPAYKQDDGLRYNGRDLAILRAKFADCPVVLGSATPSVTSFYHTTTGKYTLLKMTSRVQGQAMPEVQVVDLGAKKRSRPDLFFSDQLISALHDNMDKRLQSLLFVNRRGYAAFMLCRDCGHIIGCRHCKVSLTHHRQRNVLICHYCGYTLSPDIVCPECNSTSVVGLGVGSERIEAEVKELIPHARVARLDSDTTHDRKKYMAILQKVRNHDVDILIGTQMVAKGLHFPKMTLVGVIWADSGLGMPDYKASERVFQLLAQVTGRAGRGEDAGKVIIQTHQPSHYAIEFARLHAYEQLYTQEISQRTAPGYPPFGRLVNVKFSGENEKQVAASAQKTADYLRSLPPECKPDVLGPAPSPLAKIKKRYRWQVLLKTNQLNELHLACERLIKQKSSLCPGGVRMALDVDPENMM